MAYWFRLQSNKISRAWENASNRFSSRSIIAHVQTPQRVTFREEIVLVCFNRVPNRIHIKQMLESVLVGHGPNNIFFHSNKQNPLQIPIHSMQLKSRCYHRRLIVVAGLEKCQRFVVPDRPRARRDRRVVDTKSRLVATNQRIWASYRPWCNPIK